VWSPDTKGAPFGAHPKVDRRGNLWNIGIAGNKLLIYVIKPDGHLKRVSVHTVRDCAIAHDFVLTDHFLGVWLAPIRVNPDHLAQGDTSLLKAMEWHEQEGSQFLLFDRDRLELQKIIELDAELIFHFANAWEEHDAIHMTYVSSSYEQLQNGMLNNDNTAKAIPHRSHACLKSIDLTGGFSETVKQSECVEFPQIDERLRGAESQTVFCLSQENTNGRPRFNGIIRYELEGSDQTSWQAGEDIELEEHVYTPKDKRNLGAGGWLVGTGYNTTRKQGFCTVFDAEKLEEGPIATVFLDGPTPISLHGPFLAHS
jgi:carotenoid cleavage dioxygenase